MLTLWNLWQCGHQDDEIGPYKFISRQYDLMEFNDLVKTIYKGGNLPTLHPHFINATVVACNLPQGLDLSSTSMQFERAIQTCANKKLKGAQLR